MGEPEVTVRDPAASPVPAPDGSAEDQSENGRNNGHDAPSLPGISSQQATAPRLVDPAAPILHDDLTTPAHRVRVAPPSRRITIETALYGALMILAALTRFWDLGSRTLHHDESLHAYYSWLYATGQGYVHDPLMHGPFLFHANALVYLLLGASDATSRYMPALFGTALVGLPYFLRGPRHLGRWGALIASGLFLISPALLYQSRYIRHDIYTVVGALLLFIAIVRYVDQPERRWLVTAGATLGFLLTNHEIVFGIAAIFGGVLWGALLWGRLRSLVPLQLAFLAVAGGLWLVKPGLFGRALPEIPWSADGSESPPPTRENQMRFYWELLTHPLMIALALLMVITVVVGFVLLTQHWEHADTGGVAVGAGLLGVMAAALWLALVLIVDQEGRTHLGGWRPLAGAGAWRFVAAAFLGVGGVLVGSYGLTAVRNKIGGGEHWLTAVLGGTRTGSVEGAVLRAGLDRRGLALAAGTGAGIFVALYTSLFSNIQGLFTGTVATDGTLFYWLGQQGYRRGDQPWFYYLLLMPQYELIAVVFGVVAAVATGVLVLRVLLHQATPGPRFFFRVFLAVWFAGILASLSWAGEKMPWLVVHITLPATLLAASLLGELGERWQARATVPAAAGATEMGGAVEGRDGWRARSRRGWTEPTLMVGLLALGAGWFLLAGRLSYGTFVSSTAPGGWTRTVTSFAAAHWWWLALPPAVALALIGAAWLTCGARRSGRASLAAMVIGLALLQVHAGWRMTYLEGDVPKDMLIYTQTAPDVSRMIDEIGALSKETTGGKGMEVWYDSGVSWPLQWYLRDFPNRQLRNGPVGGPPEDVPVVIVQNANLGSWQPFLKGYTAQEYVLRWWFPEYPIYRNFAIAPELKPGSSAWKSADQPHGIGAIAGSVIDSLATQFQPAGQQRVYRLLMYRDLPERIDSFRYTMFVRNDLVPGLNRDRY